MLGICYGMQLLAYQLGGKVDPSTHREYGPAMLEIDEPCALFDDLPSSLAVWMSHGDRVTEPPPGFRSLAHSGNSPHAVIADDRDRYGIQFHPEVVHTPQGAEILRNFLYNDLPLSRRLDRPLDPRDAPSPTCSARSATAARSAPSPAASTPPSRPRLPTPRSATG